MPNSNNYIDRPPRIQPELPTGVVEIPPPPRDDEAQQPLWQAMVPVVTIVGYILVSSSGQGQNAAFILPMALSVVISTAVTVYNAFAGYYKRREKFAAYRRKLGELNHDMVTAHNRQRTFYEYNYPEPELILEMRGDKQDNRSGTRLWERRSHESDFGTMRLGRGTRPSTVIYRFDRKADGEPSSLDPEAERLAIDSQFVTNVPVILPLYHHIAQKSKGSNDKDQVAESQPILVKHLVAVSGAIDNPDVEETRQSIYAFAYSLITHAVSFHSPNDLEVFILGMNGSETRWNWAYNLPHCELDVSKGQYRLYFEDNERITAPEDGVIEELMVDRKTNVHVGDVVAKLRTKNGTTHVLKSAVAGQVDTVNARFVNRQSKNIEAKGKSVQKGEVLFRLKDFVLSDDQLKEELGDPERLTAESLPRLLELQRRKGKPYGDKNPGRKREISGIPRFWKEKIWTQLDRRANRMRDNEEKDNPNLRLPFMLIVVDLLQSDPSLGENDPLKRSWLDDIESEAAMSLLAEQGAQLGATIIFLVPSRNKVPSACQSVIELKSDGDGTLKFLYAEIGLNTPRYVGVADHIQDRQDINDEGRVSKELETFVKALKEWEVRRSYGADIPRVVKMTDLYDVKTIQELDMPKRWNDSRERAEWPQIPLGMLAGQEPRNLHFFADADGVHGMIAGSTGSGKSELLMTMILSLAIKYDPSMVNFVLIDYKGGGTFDNFKELPHVVDNVNNLGKNAVARMFAAINSELDRRQRINQRNKVKDIVRYRMEKLHKTKHENYPHLFIVIDEFAEMIANEPEYKAQLESITRLGRALGVSLILAAQRPSGVTDQMRANIKFKLCLRVETREESSELLRRPEGSMLPSIPGRGYLQVGNDSLELIQVGYSGENYTSDRFGDYDPYERYERQSIVWEEDINKEKDEPMYDVLVRRMANLKEYKISHHAYHREDTDSTDQEIIPWRRPWPGALPRYISLDSGANIEFDYLDESDRDDIAEQLRDDEPFSLAPAVARRINSTSPLDWEGVNWEFTAMRVFVGIVDDPHNSKLRLLSVDFKQGNYAIFGTAGYGKTIFLQAVLTALVASHSPKELNLYILDFGNRRLEDFKGKPHTGAHILDFENDRVERLMRFIAQEIVDRKEKISRLGVDNLYQYNNHKTIVTAQTQLPALLIVIDNFAVFKENYETQVDFLIPLVRDGLSTGVHFIVSTEQPGTLGKLFPLIPQRVSLKLSDDSVYVEIVGRGALPVEDIQGRGLQNIDRRPLEVQVAMPIGRTDLNEDQQEAERLRDLLEKIDIAAKHFNYEQPPQIERLPELLALPKLLEMQRQADLVQRRKNRPDLVVFREDAPAQFIIGIADNNLKPLPIGLNAKPHFVIVGAPSSGRTNILQNIILSLADKYTPEQVAFVLADPQNTLAEYGGEQQLTDLPHALMKRVVSNADDVRELVENLQNEFERLKDTRPPREVFVVFDNYERDDIDEMMSGSGDKFLQKLGRLARSAGRIGLHFIVAGMADTLRSGDDLTRPMGALRHGFALDYESADTNPLNASLPRIFSQMVLPRGRGFYVFAGKGHLIQVPLPYERAENRNTELDAWVHTIINQNETVAEWLPLASVEVVEDAHKLSDKQRRAIILAYRAYTMDDEPEEDFLKRYTVRDDEELIVWVEKYQLTVEGFTLEQAPAEEDATNAPQNGHIADEEPLKEGQPS